MKRLREVLERLPTVLDRSEFGSICREIRREVPIDLFGVARVSDDGSYLRLHIMWTSPDIGLSPFGWGRRVDVSRARLAQVYANRPQRIIRDLSRSPQPAERALAAAGIRCSVSVPIGRPLAAVVGFGFRDPAALRKEHLPVLREVARRLLDRLDTSLLAARAARLQAMAEAMPMGALMLGRDGTVEEVNPAAARLVGRAARHLRGRSIRDLVCAPDGGRLGWRLDRAAGPAPGLALGPDGPRSVELQLLAPPGGGGDLYGPLFVVDTSAERAAEAALQRRTEQLAAIEREHRALIDDLPVMVFTNDAQGRPTYCSAAVERLLGYTPAEIRALPSFDVLNVDTVPPDYGTVPGIIERDFRQRRKDGREVVIRYSVRIKSGPGGQVTGIEGFGVDVTAEREAQQRLLIADRLAALGLLLAGIGHEINNPAAYVSLGVQQIARHLRHALVSPDADLRAALEKALPILDDVSTGATRIGEIVGQLKLFARDPGDDAGGPIDLNALVRSAASLVSAELRTRARFTVTLGELPPLPGGWARLSQVVLNLLVNAAQAIAPGAPEDNEVTLSTECQGGEVRIEVRDTGCGIPPADRARIFDPFFTTKPVGEGTGLGLSISYDIVRRLGGAIAVESERGRGSRFRVTLPYGAPRPMPVPPDVEPPGGGRVLVVEDERPLAGAIARELGARLQVELAHSGGEALEALARARFDAVLCALRMPGLSGIDVYRRTFARDPGQAGRFVFLSGAGSQPHTAEFLRSTGRPVLEKPFPMAELWRTVAIVMAPRAGT